MTALACQGQTENIECSHHRTRMNGSRAHGQAWPVMHAVNRLHGKTLEQSVFDHYPCATFVFFCRLENKINSSCKIRIGCQSLCCTQQHRRMTIMTTGMHTSSMN